ncbi:helix-turn-helix domain-containing protein [Paenibacillus segetis]|uniref:HTH araC/xylS-type domain-containing protein n=1 Tax=Paenibacillus segetis TaxID=1325360 RepID=A0ABQ1YNH9_9BACL|nr:helix-turn-helix domain-containing protein [Paenibacillus segetis]GGH31112.1 hypothetical protein GCM10008013_34660 [Paenibacillus segetis]
MRRIRERIHLKSWFARFFFSFVVLLVAVSLSITTLLYQAFSKGSTEQINQISQQRLEQSSNMFEFIMNQARLITLQLSLDNDIIRSINSGDAVSDYFINHASLRKINDLLITNKNIYSITLYNGQNKTLIGTDRDKANAEAATIEWLRDATVQSLGRAVPRKLLVNGPTGTEQNVYTTFYYDKNPDNNEITSAIIVNLKMDSFVNHQSDNLMILDQEGHVVFGSDKSGFLDDISERHYVQRIMESSTNESFTDTIDESKTLVSSAYSEQLGWYFVSIIPYETATAQISDIRHTAFLICLLLLVLALGVSAVLSGMLSSPLSKLARKALSFQSDKGDLPTEKLSEMEILNRFYSNITSQFEQLEASSQRSRVSIKAEYFKELLHGVRIPESDDTKQYKLNVDLIESTTLYVAVLKQDNIRELAERKEEIDYTISTVLYSFTDQFMRSRIPCEIVKVENEIILIFNGGDGNAVPDSVKDVMHELQQEVAHTYGVTITIGIGCAAHGGQEISDSYLSAKEASLYRLVHGDGSIIFYEDMMPQLNSDFEYPYSKQKALLEVVKVGKEEKVGAAVADIFEALKLAPYNMIRLSVHHLLFSVVTATSADSSLTTTSATFIETLGTLQRMESLQSIADWFVQYIQETIQRTKENKKHLKSDLADDIAAFLEEQYGNPDLSIEMVAERFHYNGIYFGRLFKELFNRLFLEYVTELRIRKANEYLKDSKLTVKEIGEKVGFLNSSYFVTWYKKNTGLAPTEYRKRH